MIIFFLYWVYRPFQHISGHIKTAPACNRGYDNHFIELSHWNITPQAQSYDIPPGHIILATGQPVFALNYPLYVERLSRELHLYQLEIFGSTLPGIEPGPPRHRANALTTLLPSWSRMIDINPSTTKNKLTFKIVKPIRGGEHTKFIWKVT